MAIQPLPGLEAKTGADLLLSIEELPLSAGSPASMLKLHARSGLLVQLKRYGDLQSSITSESRLSRSLRKMLNWTSRAWLVVTGHVLEINGRAVVAEVKGRRLMKGKMARFTLLGRMGMSFPSLDGAMDAWRYHGGYAKTLPEGQLFQWLKRQDLSLRAIARGDVSELSPRSVQRELVEPSRVAWLAALFDGIGTRTSEAVWRFLDEAFSKRGAPVAPSIVDGIAYVTDYRAVEIPGISRSMITGWRNVIGLKDHGGVYETLGIQFRDADGRVMVEGARHDDTIVIQGG